MRLPTFLGRLFGAAAERATGSGSARKAIAHCRALLSERGEAAGTALARQALDACLALEGDEREAMFDALTRDFSPEPERVGKAADAYRRDPGPTTLIRLQETVEPPRQELFRRLNMAPGGTAAVVELRRRLLAGAACAPGVGGAGLRPAAPAALVVQPRLPGPGAHRLAHLGDGAGEADRLRGGARDQGLARPAPAPRGRPALLRVLSSGAARRAADLHRGRARAQHVEPRAAAAGRRRAGRRPGRGPLRDVLLDHQLPGRIARDLVREFPDQAGRASSCSASCRSCAISPPCRRCPDSGSGSSASMSRESRTWRSRAGSRRRSPTRCPRCCSSCARTTCSTPGKAANRWTRWRAFTSAMARDSSASIGSGTPRTTGSLAPRD